MKGNPKHHRNGFTLVELSVALMMGMMIGSMIIALFNQQLAFLNIYRTQNFLTEEAPVISSYVSKLVSRATRFRLHDSVDDALNGDNPRLTASPVLVLNFTQPDGEMRAAILSFEDTADGKALYYYVVPDVGEPVKPEWAVTESAESLDFSIEQGVLRMTIGGPAGERITYSGTMQQ